MIIKVIFINWSVIIEEYSREIFSFDHINMYFNECDSSSEGDAWDEIDR